MRRWRGEGTTVSAVVCNEVRKPTDEGGTAGAWGALFEVLEQFGPDFLTQREQPVVLVREGLF